MSQDCSLFFHSALSVSLVVKKEEKKGEKFLKLYVNPTFFFYFNLNIFLKFSSVL